MSEESQGTEPRAWEPEAATPANPNGDDSSEEIARSRANGKLMAFLEARAKRAAVVPLQQAKGNLGL
jgi:hypothetical protein